MTSSSNGGDCGFGYSESGNATASARFVHCRAGFSGNTTGGKQAFGVTEGDVGYVGLFSGSAHGCEIGGQAFGVATGNGDGKFEGHAEDCRCTNTMVGEAFGVAKGSGAAVCQGSLINCRVQGSGGVCFGANSGTGPASVGPSANTEIRSCYTGGGKAFGYAAAGDVSIVMAQFSDCLSFDTVANFLGKYSFGYSGGGIVEVGGMFNDCVSGAYSFGCTDSTTGGTATFSGFASDCSVQDLAYEGYCFGSAMQPGAGKALCSGFLTDCLVMGGYCFGSGYEEAECSAMVQHCFAVANAFGYAAGTSALFSGNAYDCSSYSLSFGSCGGTTLGVSHEGHCSGMVERCKAGDYSFGFSGSVDAVGVSRGRFSAQGVMLQAGDWSFGAGDGYANAEFEGRLYDAVSFGSYCFGASLNGNAQCGGLFSRIARCEAVMGRSFGYTESTSGGMALCSIYARDCVSGDYSFGCSLSSGGGQAECSGTMERCKSGDKSFGYSLSDSASCTGTKEDCVAQDSSFGSGAPGSCAGSYYRCRADNHSFGSGGASACSGATLEDCNAGYDSFGGTGQFAASTARRCRAYGASFGQTGGGGSELEDCTVTNIDTTNVPPVMALNNIVRKCRFVATDIATSPLLVGAAGIRLYDSEFISAGAASVDVAWGAPVTVAMVHCRMNTSTGALVSNSVGSPLNVVDPAVL